VHPQRPRLVVGFAAETNDIEKYALGKLKEKDLDMICLNDVGQKDAGFSVDTNIITIFTRQGEKMELPCSRSRMSPPGYWTVSKPD